MPLAGICFGRHTLGIASGDRLDQLYERIHGMT